MPSHKSEIGIQLIDGSGLNKDMMGSKIALKNGDDPRKIPTGIATRLEIKNPTITRLVEASTCRNRVPSENIFTAREKICVGDGRKIGSMKPSRQNSSHSTMMATNDAMLMYV
jgi:hypothetical protein